MATDPTVEFLERLNDLSRWEIRRGIPVFEPHTRIGKGPDGKPRKIEVTERDLPTIAEECNRLERDHGVVGRLTDRHTMRPTADGQRMEPTTPRPTLYGFQRNYRVGTYGPKSKPCILADWQIYPQHAAEVDSSPHRSVEYIHSAREIRGTAVMMNDPFLDMGMVVGYDATNRVVYFYAMGDDVPDDKKPTDDKDADTGDVSDKKPGDKKDGSKAEDFKPEEKDLFEKACRYLRQTYQLDEGWPKGAEKKPAGDDKKPDDKPTDKADEVTPMSSDKTPVNYEKQIADMQTNYEKKLADLATDFNAKLAAEKARNDGLALERDHEKCGAMLYALEVEGYTLSEDQKKKELAKLAATPAAERADRVKELKAIYADTKVPGGRLDLYHGPVEGVSDTNDPTKEPPYHQAALQYMRENIGTQYDQAVAKVKAFATAK